MRDLLILAVVSAVLPMAGSFVMPLSILLPILAKSALSLGVMSFGATTLAGLIEADRRRETARANVFYRGIIDTLPEPLNAKDLAGRFLAANPGHATGWCARCIGADRNTDFDFFPQYVAGGFRADEARVLAAGEPETIEQVLTRQDGTRSWLSRRS